MGWLRVAGVVADNYALEMVILAHCEGEMWWLGVAGVVVDNYALEVVILAHCAMCLVSLVAIEAEAAFSAEDVDAPADPAVVLVSYFVIPAVASVAG